jgi:hypothetical protein
VFTFSGAAHPLAPPARLFDAAYGIDDMELMESGARMFTILVETTFDLNLHSWDCRACKWVFVFACARGGRVSAGSGAGTTRAPLERLALPASQVGVARRQYHPLRQARTVFGPHAPGSMMFSCCPESLRSGSACAPLRVSVCVRVPVCMRSCLHVCKPRDPWPSRR